MFFTLVLLCVLMQKGVIIGQTVKTVSVSIGLKTEM